MIELAAGRQVDVAMLQWGRGLLAPEWKEAPRELKRYGMLQWGRGLLAPE